MGMFKFKNVSQFDGRYHSVVRCLLNMEDLIWNNFCKSSKLQAGAISRGIKRVGLEADHPRSSSAEINNGRAMLPFSVISSK
jgi:hypothetical protein